MIYPVFTMRRRARLTLGSCKEGVCVAVQCMGRALTALEQLYDPRPLMSIESGAG
jgi:hypothetical protein